MGNVKCLRTQLPRANPYYSYDPAVSHTKSDTEPGATAPTLCALCGSVLSKYLVINMFSS